MINMDLFMEGEHSSPIFRDLIKAAKIRSESVPENLKRATCLYYMSARQLTLYGMQFSEAPNEVLDEYRKGLDYLLRFLSKGDDMPEDNRRRNLNKMEDGMERAFLWICEHYVIKVNEWAKEFEEGFGKNDGKVVNLSSDSDFVREWREMRKVIRTDFESAKIKKAHLGEDDPDSVVELYLLVAYKCHQLMQSGRENGGNIALAQEFNPPSSK